VVAKAAGYSRSELAAAEGKVRFAKASEVVTGCRVGQKMSKRKLAREAGCCAGMIVSIEAGTLRPSVNLAHRLFVALGMSNDDRDSCCQDWTTPETELLEVWAGVAGGSCP
jgi:DNA-binding XRE family transcriptional regulator